MGCCCSCADDDAHDVDDVPCSRHALAYQLGLDPWDNEDRGAAEAAASVLQAAARRGRARRAARRRVRGRSGFFADLRSRSRQLARSRVLGLFDPWRSSRMLWADAEPGLALGAVSECEPLVAAPRGRAREPGSTFCVQARPAATAGGGGSASRREGSCLAALRQPSSRCGALFRI